jgi:hypothetical protein
MGLCDSRTSPFLLRGLKRWKALCLVIPNEMRNLRFSVPIAFERIAMPNPAPYPMSHP